jgi:hypothetical protein
MRMVAAASIAFVAAVNLTFGATAAKITLETVLARAAAYVSATRRVFKALFLKRSTARTTPPLQPEDALCTRASN